MRSGRLRSGVADLMNEDMARIPKVLQEHINTAFPDFVTLVGTALPDGYAQITPRGGTIGLRRRASGAVGTRQGFDSDEHDRWDQGDGVLSQAVAAADGTLPRAASRDFMVPAQIVPPAR